MSALYATPANPTLQRHHWQNLAGFVQSLRPEWPVDRIIEELWTSGQRTPFPELSKTAVAVALDPRFKTPGSIHLAASGVIAV